MVKVNQIVHKEPIIMGLHDLPYLETDMSGFGHYPYGGLFVSHCMELSLIVCGLLLLYVEDFISVSLANPIDGEMDRLEF